MPPVVTRTRDPLSIPLPRLRCTLARISSGSARRPIPESDPVRRPIAGSIISIPRCLRVLMFAIVAAFCHISVCIAGATSTGQVAASTVEVNKSSAIPAAIFAINDAVAGATTMQSAFFEIAMCLTCSTSVYRSGSTTSTGFFESASSVTFPMKRWAFMVVTI